MFATAPWPVPLFTLSAFLDSHSGALGRLFALAAWINQSPTLSFDGVGDCFYSGRLAADLRVLDSEETAGLGLSGLSLNNVFMEYLPELSPAALQNASARTPDPPIDVAARRALYTGHIGDGKVFVYGAAEAVKVRTGEHGFDAVQSIDVL